MSVATDVGKAMSALSEAAARKRAALDRAVLSLLAKRERHMREQ